MLLGSFMMIIVGVTLIGTVGDSVNDLSFSSDSIVNETIGLTAGVGAAPNNDEWISLDAVRNGSADVHTSQCNATLLTGIIKCNDTATATNNVSCGAGASCFVDYTYTPDTFVADGTSRTLVNLVTIFFAVAIFALAAGMAMASFRGMGLL